MIEFVHMPLGSCTGTRASFLSQWTHPKTTHRALSAWGDEPLNNNETDGFSDIPTFLEHNLFNIGYAILIALYIFSP